MIYGVPMCLFYFTHCLKLLLLKSVKFYSFMIVVWFGNIFYFTVWCFMSDWFYCICLFLFFSEHNKANSNCNKVLNWNRGHQWKCIKLGMMTFPVWLYLQSMPHLNTWGRYSHSEQSSMNHCFTRMLWKDTFVVSFRD